MDLSSQGGPTCYTSFRAAIAAATDGRVTDAPNNVATAMASRRLAAELNQTPSGDSISGTTPMKTNQTSPTSSDSATSALRVAQTASSSSYVLGIEYVDANWQGSTFTWTGNHTCASTLSDIDYYVPSLVPYGWNDVISSFDSYSNCWTKLFENANFTGATYGFADSTSYVGDAMNDRASSIQFS
ncbi:MAG: hypothetical protein ABSG43_25580 [Solirubrobacteraceae bacterium]|jgi:hypothetical protein